jgi:hypothetical protein
MVVLSGRAVEGGGAFRPVVEALVPAAPAALAGVERLAPYRGVLARLLPGWPAEPEVPPALTDPIVLLGEAVMELLEVGSGGHGIALLLDDLHWADRDTMALLGYLAGRIGRAGIVVVGAARDDEPAQGVVRTLVQHPAVRELALARLGDEEGSWCRPWPRSRDSGRQAAQAPDGAAVPQPARGLRLRRQRRRPRQAQAPVGCPARGVQKDAENVQP